VRMGAQRGGAGDIRITAIPGKDVVVLHVVGGPVLVLHPHTARDLLLAQVPGTEVRGAKRARAARNGEVKVPARLQWMGVEPGAAQRGRERGAPGTVRLSAVEIVSGVAKDVAADFATSEVVRRVDAQVDAGVFRLSSDALRKLKGTAAPLRRIPSSPDGGPLLILVHGTFSETSGTFGKLWVDHPQHVRSLFDHYRRRVYGLEHPTLGVSPIENAFTLAQACPKGARLHVVSHSRGGLVAEVLARVCARPRLNASDYAFFKGADYRRQRETLKALGKVVAERKLRVERIVRVACPSRGTLLASKRLDAYVSILKWALELASVPVAPAIVDFLGEVAQRRADPELLPGLAAQIPDSPLVRWLNAADEPIAGDLRVVAGDIEGDSVISWLKALLADAFYWTENDLVVQTGSMYGGVPRATGATFLLDRGAKVSHFNYFHNKRTAAAIVNALVQQKPPGFRVIGPLSSGGSSPTGTRAVSARAVDVAPASDESTVVVAPGSRPSAVRFAAPDTALKISVINGDLMFVRQPLLLGHYTSTRLTGTENVVDKLLGGAMSNALGAGLYPYAPGAHQIFLNTGVNRDNPLQLPRPEAAIVVGLGAEGKLVAADLAGAVRQAAMAWSQRMTETYGGATGAFELASTLIGSGGMGISPGQAAQLVAQGVHEANERMAKRGWPVVGHLHLVELYLDRAGDAWRALQVQAAAAPGDFVAAEPVAYGPGALPRLLDSGYRGADYDLISAATQEGKGGESLIVYTLDTKRARSEIRAQATQSRLLRQLGAGAPQTKATDEPIGRALFNLLIPLEMEPFLGGTTDIQLEVDGGTAGIPWEMLESDASDDGSDPRPWAVRTKLLRKLRTADFRAQVADATADDSVLVIGEPACDPDIYPRLWGARDEAEAVAQRLSAALGAHRVQALISPDDPDKLGADARTIVNALLGRDWRIVHVAGHGALPEKIGAPSKKKDESPQADIDPRGVVLSDGTFLGPREIRSMRRVPELVFVNCCHLAARDAAQLLTPDGTDRTALPDRPRFAAGVAEELIKIGVRCVIAAGWAVDDAAAKAFAIRFYDALVRGRRFIDAVAEARQDAWEKGGNTWAAYQCYGDPDWVFAPEASDAQRPSKSFVDEFAGVASSKGLLLALESLAVKSKFQKALAPEQQAKIRHLETTYATRWGGIGEIAEGFGRAWDEAGDRDEAIKWYTRALGANDGTASLKVVEQLGNLRARQGFEMTAKAAQANGAHVGMPPAGPRKRSEAARSRRDNATKARGAVYDAARAEIVAAVAVLERITNLQPSIERESLCGSAWKRMALLEAHAKRPSAETKAIMNMKLRYANAETLARASNHSELFYPALNRMAAELIVDAARPGWRGFDSAALAEVKNALAAKTRDDPDFWSVVGLTELRLYEAIARRALAIELEAILREYRDLHARVSATTSWSSVLDQVRFVLPKYERRAAAAEKKATRALTKYLEGLAGANARIDSASA
jgi:tetratricopeptide (TPR) repeat protein